MDDEDEDEDDGGSDSGDNDDVVIWKVNHFSLQAYHI